MQGESSYAYAPPGSYENIIDLGSVASTSSSKQGQFNLASFQNNRRVSAARTRNVDRACDACRRRKTKCDGPKMPDNVCTNCAQVQKTCTYVEASKPRGPPKAYVTGLEDKLEKMEALLKLIRPDSDFSDELGPPVIRGSWKEGDSNFRAGLPDSSDRPASRARSSSSQVTRASTSSLKGKARMVSTSASTNYSTHLILDAPSHTKRVRKKSDARTTRSPTRPTHPDSDAESSGSYSMSDSDDLVDNYERGMHKLTLRATESATSEDATFARYLGTSSTIGVVDVTRKFRQAHMLKSMENSASLDPPSPKIEFLSRRPQFWRPNSWEMAWESENNGSEFLQHIISEFPPCDLSVALVNIFFEHLNTQFPLLHQPTFFRQWGEELYKRNLWFACLCMSIFALSSRWSDDPRVLPKGDPKQENGDLDWTRAGWDYFTLGLTCHRRFRSLLYPVSLFELQTFPLLSMFMKGTVDAGEGWVFLSVGIRKAQDIGAHRKSVYSGVPSVDEELWKRAFWMLVAHDRIYGAGLGRTCSIGEEDFDLDMFTEVDDEYWQPEDPAQAFRQPAGVPSRIEAFTLWVKLTQIVAFVLRTIYPVNKASMFFGCVHVNDSEETVKQLNRALSEWVDSVPEHLRWSHQYDNQLFSNQAATLFTTYYLTQILIYRPFIPSNPASPFHHPHSPAQTASALSSQALAICSNAAKSCARIIDNQMQHGLSNIPNMIAVAQISAAILLVNVWDLKAKAKLQKANGDEDIKPPLAQSIETLMNDINICVRALEWAAHRYGSVKILLKSLRESMTNVNEEFDTPYISDADQEQLDSHIHEEITPLTHVSSGTHPTLSPERRSSHHEAPLWQWITRTPPMTMDPSHVPAHTLTQPILASPASISSNKFSPLTGHDFSRLHSFPGAYPTKSNEVDAYATTHEPHLDTYNSPYLQNKSPTSHRHSNLHYNHTVPLTSSERTVPYISTMSRENIAASSFTAADGLYGFSDAGVTKYNNINMSDFDETRDFQPVQSHHPSVSRDHSHSVQSPVYYDKRAYRPSGMYEHPPHPSVGQHPHPPWGPPLHYEYSQRNAPGERTHLAEQHSPNHFHSSGI